jgi:hypothetical protein
MVKRIEKIDKTDGQTDTVAFSAGCFGVAKLHSSAQGWLAYRMHRREKNPTYDQV